MGKARAKAVERVPMDAGKRRARYLLLLAMAGCAFSQEASAPPTSTPAESQAGTSKPTEKEPASTVAGEAKKESSTHRPAHHIKVAVEDSAPPELTRAEAEIEKRDYAAAEPLLRKLVEKDSTNYVAWFDLGFVENALGKMDESVAAYRKSVVAKPDVFESNLNLGLQLAKTGQPEAEAFLRAAKKLSPIFPRAGCSKKKISLPTLNWNTSRRWRSMPSPPTA